MWSRCLCRCQCAGVWLYHGRGIDPRCGAGVCAGVHVLGYDLTREGGLIPGVEQVFVQVSVCWGMA